MGQGRDRNEIKFRLIEVKNVGNSQLLRSFLTKSSQVLAIYSRSLTRAKVSQHIYRFY